MPLPTPMMLAFPFTLEKITYLHPYWDSQPPIEFSFSFFLKRRSKRNLDEDWWSWSPKQGFLLLLVIISAAVSQRTQSKCFQISDKTQVFVKLFQEHVILEKWNNSPRKLFGTTW